MYRLSVSPSAMIKRSGHPRFKPPCQRRPDNCDRRTDWCRKTTIINLLMRFYELNKGSIKVGGTDISELSREQARSMFAMVLQDTWLFNGTIRENIAYGRDGATDEDIIRRQKPPMPTILSVPCRTAMIRYWAKMPKTSRKGSGSSSRSREPF